MKFLVCPTKCSTGIELDDSPSSTPTTSTKRPHKGEKPGEDKEALIADEASASASAPEEARSRGFINVFRALGAIAFRRPQASGRTESRSYQVFGRGSHLERRQTLKDLSKSDQPSKIPVQKPQRKNVPVIKNYPGSPRRLAGSPRKIRSVPPEKPKRLLVDKKSPVLNVKKTTCKSPVTGRAGPPKPRKGVKQDKKGKTVVNETSFLSTIAEEGTSKFFFSLN